MRADLKEWMLKTSEELQGLGNKVLLWTNPSPTAAFGAQTVISNTDLTIYDEIEIYYAGNTGYPDCVHVVKQSANTNSYIFGSSNSLTARNVVITGNSLSFGKGIRYAYAGNGSDDNAQLIPQKIYGVIIGATGGGGSGGGTSDYEDLENKPTINGVTLVEGLVTEDLNLGDTAHEEISQADFDALTSEEQNDGTVYFITDGVASNVFVDDNVPVGTIAPYGGSNDPAYWLICDGRAISRTAYSELFSVIGTTYGNGDGNTTFNIPDLQGNVTVGASENYSLGDTGGSKDAIVVSHNHGVITEFGAQATQAYPPGNTSTYSQIAGSTAGTKVNNTYSIQSAGSSGENANMQPYVVTNYIIKAKTALSENQSQLDFFYPVGSYYETSDSTFNPNARWGGTWEKVLSNTDGDYLIDKQTKSVTVASGMHGITFSITTPAGYYVESCTIIRTPNPNWVYGSLTSITNTSVEFIYNNTYSGSITGDLMIEIIFKNSCEKYRWHRVA